METIKISTPFLRKKITNTIEKIAPLFALSAEEVNLAMQFEVKRTLKYASKIYRNHYEHHKYTPAYAFLHNFFYFPIKDKCPEIESVSHEVGHHLHNIINPKVKEGVIALIRTGKLPKGHAKLTEIVAEYANLILKSRKFSDPFYKAVHEIAYEDSIRVYSQYGSEFLPVLSRMSLDESIQKGIVIV